MPHPLDAEDTDWGHKIEARHLESLTRLDGIDRRLGTVDGHIVMLTAEQERVAVSLARLDERMKASEGDRRVMRDQLDVNTTLTKLIKDDTAWIVRFAQGAKGIKKFLIWAAPIASAFIAAYVAWTLKK